MTRRLATILLADDYWQDIKPLLTGFSMPVTVLTEARADQIADRLETNPEISVLLLDLLYEGQNLQGEQVYDLVSQRFPQLPIIILSASRDIGLALRLSHGSGGKKPAYNYFVKDQLDRQQLLLTIENAIAWYELQKSQSRFTDQGAIVSCSRIMDDVLSLVARAARTDLPVLIIGESGTGKELIARAIHQNSQRKSRPFVAINCGALPTNLVESELFGTARGAFTGAIDRKGAFERATGGTLLLDEVGEMALDQQPTLLRVLEEKSLTRVGGQSSIKIDTRLIASTNKNLLQSINEKTFREDLFYRLNVFHIDVPPLRARCEDIPLLIDHFINMVRPGTVVTSRALERLQAHSWPGNVRQLQNTINQALALSDGDVLDIETFAALTETVSEQEDQSKPWIDRLFNKQIGWTDLTGEFRIGSQALQAILTGVAKQWRIEHNTRITGDDYAQLLGINRNHVNQILKQHGLMLRNF